MNQAIQRPFLNIKDMLAETTARELAEKLSEDWLGMYFYGLSFPPIWEHVHHIAEETGGFPGIQSINKALGDVFRITRNISDVDRSLYIYTSRPLGMLPLDQFDSETSSYVALGRLYYWLQLRLCVLENVTVHYIVDRTSLEGGDPAKAIAQTLRTFGDEKHTSSGCLRSNVTIYIHNGTADVAMGAFGYKTGVYTLPRSMWDPVSNRDRRSFPIFGNRAISTMVDIYTNSLKEHIIRDAIVASSDARQATTYRLPPDKVSSGIEMSMHQGGS